MNWGFTDSSISRDLERSNPSQKQEIAWVVSKYEFKKNMELGLTPWKNIFVIPYHNI